MSEECIELKAVPPACPENEAGDHTTSISNHKGPKRPFNFIHIIVSGDKFKTRKETLDRYPDTLLGSVRKETYWNPSRAAYVFPNRCRRSFESILYFYQSEGILSQPKNVGRDHFMMEAEFFEIPLNTLRTNTTHNQWSYAYVVRKDGLVNSNIGYPAANYKHTRLSMLFRENTWTYKVIMTLDVFVTVCFVFCHIASTVTTDERDKDGNVKLDEDHKPKKINAIPIGFINRMELACIVWILGHYVAGMIISPKRTRYLLSFMPMVDAIIVLAFAVDWTIKITDYNNYTGMPLRAICVLRLFNLARHSTLLYCLGLALRQSFSDLMHVLLVIIFIIFLAAGFVYFVEGPECPQDIKLKCNYTATNFTNVFASSYWAAVTITTVGYGDMVPKTTLGKVAGSTLALIGLPLIAIPMPLIMSKFDILYKSITEHQKVIRTGYAGRGDLSDPDSSSNSEIRTSTGMRLNLSRNGRFAEASDNSNHCKLMRHAYSDTCIVAPTNIAQTIGFATLSNVAELHKRQCRRRQTVGSTPRESSTLRRLLRGISTW